LPVAPLLKILALSMFPICVGHVFSYSLIALEKHRIYLAISILAVLLNIVLNIFMIPAYFAKGAAISTFITEILITLMYVLVVKQEIQHAKSSASL
jgi:O-antigen/teichoic acid export membrane protein